MDNRNTNFRHNPYKVPDSYFEQEEKKWLNHFAAQKEDSPVRSIKSWSMIAASLVVILTAAFAWYINGDINISQDVFLADDESLEYLLHEQDLGNLVIDSELGITELELNDIKLEYIEAYLDETFDYNDLLIIDN